MSPCLTVWPRHLRRAALAFGLLLALPAAQASRCDDLRASIEDRIRANGVRDFTVSVVDAASSAPGRIVGTCGAGGRKIVYARVGQPGGVAPAAPPRGRRDTVITECRDGRVITQGSCPE